MPNIIDRTTRAFLFLTALFALLIAVSMPLVAQEDDELDDTPVQIAVTGEITVDEEGNILVGGVIIAPASSFVPAILIQGDIVTVTGFLLNDDTLLATGIQFMTPEEVEEFLNGGDDDEADNEEGDNEGDDEADDEEGDNEGDDEADDEEADDEEEEVVTWRHPVGAALAAEFGLEYDEVMAWHQQGFGFGEIARALLLAEQLDDEDTTAEDLLAAKQEGGGWGNIMRAYDVHPSSLAPGRVISNNPRFRNNTSDDADDDEVAEGDEESATTTANTPGRGNGGPPAHVGGGQGRGNGNGNGGPPANVGRPDHAGGPGNNAGGQGRGRGGGRP